MGTLFDVVTDRKDEGVAECMNDIKGIVTAAEDIVNEAKSGKVDIATILKDAEAIVSDVKAAESDCNFVGTSLGAGDLAACMKDVEDIVTNAKDVLSQVQSGKPNFAQLLTDVENIMADVKKAQGDCTMGGLKEKNIMSCVHEIEDMIAKAKDIVSQAKSGKPNFAQMLEDVNAITNDVTKAQTDCKLAREFHFPRFHNGSCKTDMATLAKEAFQLLKDASARNWNKMLAELPEMIKTIQQAEADCQ